jgi:hypothetical protein
MQHEGRYLARILNFLEDFEKGRWSSRMMIASLLEKCRQARVPHSAMRSGPKIRIEPHHAPETKAFHGRWTMK